MHGIERAEIEQLKQINLKEYLLSFDKGNYRHRSNGTIVNKNKSHIVIYEDHSYQFNTTVNAYKDNIGTLQTLYGWTFMETVEKLRAYQKRTTPKEAIPHYNKYDQKGG